MPKIFFSYGQILFVKEILPYKFGNENVTYFHSHERFFFFTESTLKTKFAHLKDDLEIFGDIQYTSLIVHPLYMDRPDMTLNVYLERKTTMQQQQQQPFYMTRCFGYVEIKYAS